MNKTIMPHPAAPEQSGDLQHYPAAMASDDDFSHAVAQHLVPVSNAGPETEYPCP